MKIFVRFKLKYTYINVLFSARLPFKLLDTKAPPVGSIRNKKRKSDTTLVQTKAPKSAKNDDTISINQVSPL